MMNTAPKSLRLHIGIFGRTNVGKSSFLNYVTAQDVSITSSEPGTTTDVVEKTMELLPIGPVVFHDTAGLDDTSILADERIRKTQKAFARTDVVVLVVEPNIWSEFEERIISEAHARTTPVIIVVNKTDRTMPSEEFLVRLQKISVHCLLWSSVDAAQYGESMTAFKSALRTVCPHDFFQPPTLIGDFVKPGGIAVLIVPIDLEAPKGRLILPQVQAVRDTLDNDAASLVVKEREYASVLHMLNRDPDIVVCDSQVVLKMTADTPARVPCTTFSILFARYKGDLLEMARGAAHLHALKPGERVLIAESCSHHPIEDDIGRIKIPRWIRQYVGGDVVIDTVAGRDYPRDLEQYRVIIHCGGCMMNRKEMGNRIMQAKECNVPITNYGMAIALLQGVAVRVMAPFPAALSAFQQELKRIQDGVRI